MSRRFVAGLLLLACGLTAGCRLEASEEPASTVTESPAAPIFDTPEPTPAFGPALALVTPLAPDPHPLGTRTGIAKVDAVIAAFEAGDAAGLASLINFYPVPCTEAIGVGALPCAPGMPVGTPVDVFGYGSCEGTWVTGNDPVLPSVIPGFMVSRDGTPFDARIYAVIQGRLFPGEPVPGDTVIIYSSGLAMALDAGGLTYISAGCGSTGKQWLETRIARMGSQPYLLPPLR